VLYLTSTENKQKFISIKQIADELNISFHFLTKIFQILSQHGIMTSARGPAGGISLAKPASEISLIDIITALEGTEYFKGCILALPNCCDKTPCPFYDFWASMREEIKNMFEQTSLEELGQKIKKHGLRLTSIEEWH
jgi:Rrf2 family protein